MGKKGDRTLKNWEEVRDLCKEAEGKGTSLALKRASQDAVASLDPDERRAFVQCVLHGHECDEERVEILERAKEKLTDVKVNVAPLDEEMEEEYEGDDE